MLEIQKRLRNSFYAILSLPATAMGFALCVQISALSWILKTKYNLSIEEIGIVWASGPLAGLVMQLVVGVISDKVWFWGGRRRPFIIIGGVIASLMLLCLPNLDVIQKLFGVQSLIPIAFCVAMTLDLAINLGFNPTRSIITDVTPDGKERTKGYTWMQTVSGTFGVAAYFIGAYINNYALIYCGVFLVAAFTILPVFFIKEAKEFEKQTQHSFSNREVYATLEPLFGSILLILYNFYKLFFQVNEQADTILTYILLTITIIFLFKPFLFRATQENPDTALFKRVLSAHAFTWLGVQTMFVFMFAYAAQILYNTTDTEILVQSEKDNIGQIINWSFLILNAVGALLPKFILEPLTKKYNSIQVQSMCILIMSIAYSLIVFIGKSTIILYICMAIAGIGWAAIVSLPFAIISERVDKLKMGLFMGIFNMSIVIPQLIVSLIFARYIDSAENKNVIFIISAVSLFISFVLWRLVKEKKFQN